MPLCEPFANRMVERSRVDLWHLAVTQLFDHSRHMGSLFKSFINSNGCTTCGPEITFFLWKWMAQSHSSATLLQLAYFRYTKGVPPNATTTMTSKHKLQLASTSSVSIFSYFFLLCFHGYWPRWFSLASSGSDHQEDHCYQVLPLEGAYPVQKRASRTAADDSSQ